MKHKSGVRPEIAIHLLLVTMMTQRFLGQITHAMVGVLVRPHKGNAAVTYVAAYDIPCTCGYFENHYYSARNSINMIMVSIQL